MFKTTIVMAILCLVALVFAYDKNLHIKGLINGKDLLLQVLPLLFFAFILAGILQTLIPAEVVTNWVGQGSGIKGILIGSVVGGLIPGGPYVSFPIIAGLGKMGASIPVIVSMLTGWSLLSITRMPFEIGIVGPKVFLVKLVSVIIFAPLAGLIARLLVRVFKIA